MKQFNCFIATLAMFLSGKTNLLTVRMEWEELPICIPACVHACCSALQLLFGVLLPSCESEAKQLVHVQVKARFSASDCIEIFFGN